MQQMAPPQALPSRLCSVLGSAAPGTQGGSALCILSLCITSISRGFGIAFVKSYLFVNLTAQGCCGVGFHFSGITRSLEMANAPFPSNRHGHGLALQSPFYRILGHKTKMTPVDASCPDSLESGRFHLWFEFSLVQHQGLLKLETCPRQCFWANVGRGMHWNCLPGLITEL